MKSCASKIKRLQQFAPSDVFGGERDSFFTKILPCRIQKERCFAHLISRAKRIRLSGLLALFFKPKQGAFVQKLLSCVLSLCVLASSVTPSLAQVVPLKGVKQIISAGAASKAVPQTLQGALMREVLQREALASVASGKLNAVALSLPQAQALSASILQNTAAVSSEKLHNDWLGLAVNFEEIGRVEAPKASVLLRKALAEKQAVLSEIPYQDLTSLLEAAESGGKTGALAQVQSVLADASALALVGTAQDARALIAFAEAARGTVLEETAAVIAARGMLRGGAYEALNEWLAQKAPMGAFSQELAQYVAEAGLPVSVPVGEAAAETVNPALQRFLEAEGSLHGLHADVSQTATRAWVDLGHKNAPVAAQTPTAAEQKIRPAALEKIEIPAALGAQNRITLAAQPLGLAGAKPAQTPAVAPQQPAVVEAAEVSAAQTPAVAQTQPKAVQASSSSGVLYSGIPVFEIERGIKKILSFFREKKEARAVKNAAKEEEGLHENTVRPVYQEAVPVEVNDADDLLSAAEPETVAVEKEGYKLTLEDASKTEHILHNVSLSVSPMLDQFSSEYNRIALTNEYIFELRNQVIAPTRPDHFFFALNPEGGALETLIKGTKQLNMARPMRVKIQRSGSPREVVSVRLYGDDSLQEFVSADLDKSLLPPAAQKEGVNGYLVQRDGKVFYVSPELNAEFALDKYVVRLPKEESRYWAKVFEQNPDTAFALNVYSTKEKTFAWTYLVPTMQIGLGKTMSPELSARTNLGESASSIIMLCINNVLPVLMGFVHKSLKRYGEAAIGRIGVGSFVAGSAIALLSGLYGHLGDGLMSPWQTAGFVASSVLIAVGTNITRFVQNILITANRGKIVPQNSFKKEVRPAADASGAEPVYNGAYLAKRLKEVFTKSPKGSARDVVLFQTASMFKNVGTMLFLSFPWLANGAVKLISGVDLNLDFSASYVPYCLFSAWTLAKVCKTAYKDAFPTALNLLENNVQETSLQAFKDISRLSPAEWVADNPVFVKSAKQLKGSIDAITPVQAREKGGKELEISAQYREQIPARLAAYLTEQGVSLEEAQQAAKSLKEALENQGRRDVKVWEVFKMKGLPAGLAAMTLATFHELAISNGFAFGMRAIVGHGATSNALTALALYGSMSAGRILGNILSRRVSGGTMYAVSSTMSVLGTAMMAASNGNIAPLITGAVIASFGVGNFFSQMYEYLTGLYPKFRREIALLINYTMPAAAVLTFPMRALVQSTGISNLDLLISGGGLLASLILTPGMFANSSIVKALQHSWKTTAAALKKVFSAPKAEGKTPTDIDDALPN